MDPLNQPSKELWEERQKWYESVIDSSQHPSASYLVSEQAAALTIDVEIAFCAGAWACVIVMAMAAIEAHLAECEVERSMTLQKLIQSTGDSSELQALRKRRNELVHLNEGRPGLTVDEQWGDRAHLEIEAKRAVEMLFATMFMSPGV